MKNVIAYLACIACVGGIVSANGDSLLELAKFPKTFQDLPFTTRMDVLAKGYEDFEPIYDDNTGRCISGCAYSGMTIESETDAMNRNTQMANAAIIAYYTEQQSGEPVESTTTPQPYPNLPLEQPTNEPFLQSVPSQTQTTQTIAQIPLNNCSPNRVVRMTDIPGNSPIVGDIRITSDFGPRKAPIAGATSWHKGIDISVPTGTPVYATANGTVEYIADQGNKDGGKYILIKHNDSRFRTAYFHLSDNNVLKVGDTVRAGDLIGKSGNTGNSTGPHLDYRIFYTAPNKSFGWGSDAIDPLWVKNYLETQYRFANQSIKSCLHDKNNFCAGQSSVKQTPPETLPCEIK